MVASKGIYGLSGSGMDVDDMVKKMMSAQQARYDKMFKNKTRVGWQKAAYNTQYKAIEKFRFDTLPNYKLQGAMSAKLAKSRDETIATAKANGDAIEMTHDINVKQLAKNAYLQSDKITRMNDDGTVNPDMTSTFLRDSMGTEMPDAPIEPKVPVEPTLPVEPEAPASDATPDEILKYQEDMQKYQKELTEYPTKLTEYQAYKLEYDTTLKPKYDAEMVVYNAELDKTAMSFRIGNGVGTDKVLTYTYRDLLECTFNNFASDINKLDINLQASYDNNNDSFSISNKTGGEDNKISFGVYTGGIKVGGKEIPGVTDPADIKRTQTLFNNLHLCEYDEVDGKLDTALELTNTDPVSVQGRSAEAIVDGKKYTSTDNHILAGGVNYTLNKIGSTQATVTGDTEAVVDSVKKFVEDYNKMIDSLNQMVYQSEYKEYLPLTNDEKSAMSEDQIKQWEEKAKSGLLKNDSILKGLVSDMRSAISRPIDGIGKYNSMAKLGITTGDTSEHGKLHLEEDVLRKVLKEEPNAVYNVFATSVDEYDKNGVINDNYYDESGVTNRLSGVLKTSMDKINIRAGLTDKEDMTSLLGQQMFSMTEKMSKFQKQMDAYQTRLYKQFNAMETAMASLNSQMNFVTSYTSSGS